MGWLVNWLMDGLVGELFDGLMDGLLVVDSLLGDDGWIVELVDGWIGW